MVYLTEIKIINHAGREEELIELFKISFNKEMSLKLWRWKHLENPMNLIPHIVVAVDGSRIIGSRPVMPVELCIGFDKIKAGQPCDTMVHPHYRRQGIYSRMNKKTASFWQNQGIQFFYSFPNSMSLPGNLKYGGKKVYQIETLLHVNNASAVLTEKLGNQLLGKVLGFFYNKLLKQTFDLDEKLNQNYYVNIYDSFPEKLIEIDSLYNTERIELLRSEKYLKWRFDQHPVNNYTYLLLNKEDELFGYAVISTFKYKQGLKFGRIVDYLVKNNDLECFRVLMAYSLVELKKSDCDAIFFGDICNPDFRKILISQFGFKSLLSFPYSFLFKGKGFFTARQLNKTLIKQIDIYDQSNWNLTSLYRDTA